jgi:hypothetical protein
MNSRNKPSLIGKIKENTSSHIIDGIAQATAYTPIFTGIELYINGMTDDVSLNARLLAVALTFGGFATLFGKGREKWRNQFNITQESPEKLQLKHDSLYGGAFNLGIVPFFYLAAGTSDPKELAFGTGMGIIFGLTSTPLIGYAMDTYKDFTGLAESPRLPQKIKSLDKKVKIGLAGILTATSLALTAGIYQISPDKFEGNNYIEYSEKNPHHIEALK